MNNYHLFSPSPPEIYYDYPAEEGSEPEEEGVLRCLGRSADDCPADDTDTSNSEESYS